MPKRVDSEPLWRPDSGRIADANLTAFLSHLDQAGVEVGDYAAAHRWSIDSPSEFWSQVWRFCGIQFSRPWESVVDDVSRMPGARWFSGSRLNFAQNLLAPESGEDRVALISWNESGPVSRMGRAELRARTAGLAKTLAGLGVVAGDRVAAFLPNIPEAVIAMLATAGLGGVWSSCSPEFGVDAVLDRFGQIEPKVLICADGYVYAQRRFDRMGRIRRIVQALPSVEAVILVPYLERAPDLAGLGRGILFDDASAPCTEMEFTQTPFDHPLYILYSSGTTGLPKCIVHGAGGTLLQHLKELVLHTDLKPQDRIFYFTTCGWMMWNWLVSSLAVGASVVLFDGSPFHPHSEILFEMAEREEITVFGTSPGYLTALEKQDGVPGRRRTLAGLRTVLSTGSPLAPRSFDFVYDKIKRDVCLSSISGGTDLISCFALGNPIGAVYRGEIQAPGLGMAVQVYDENGSPRRRGQGELVCTQAFPSMPLGFWDDPGRERFLDAYFRHFPGVWRHGDWAEFTEHGGLVIHGRSDATLNPFGVRFGTAEIYRIVEGLREVLAAVAVDQEWDGDKRVLLFVCLRRGHLLDDGLRETIRRLLRDRLSPRHVPAKIVQVQDIPRTISGKISELAVRNVVHGRPVGNAEALSNPEALDHYRDLPQLQEI